MRIGLISDTHLPSSIREPWPEVAEAFRDVDLILHAGDIVAPRILDWLEGIAPVLAALGNDDFGMVDPRVKQIQLLEAEGWRIGVVHNAHAGIPLGQPVDIVVSGHTHFERLVLLDGVVHINPGSATLPHQHSTRLGTVGILEVERDQLSAAVVRLGDGPRVGGDLLLNPGLELHLQVPRDGLHPGA